MKKRSSGLDYPKGAFKNLAGLSNPLLERALVDWMNLKLPSLKPSEHEKKEFRAPYARLRLRYGSLADPVSLVIIHSFLHAAWDAPDLRSKEWFLYRLRDVHAKMERRRTMSPELQLAVYNFATEMGATSPANAAPPVTPVEEMCVYLLRNSRRARKCASPECPAPYFFSTKRRQVYCGIQCSRVAKLAVKRRWFHRNKSKGR